MQSKYEPILVSVEMNQYGYWTVTWSPEPALRFPVTVCQTGISREEAVSLARAVLDHTPGKGEST